MKFRLVQLAEQRHRRWSGGEATDIFCFPEGSCFEKFDFDYCISTAACEDLHSVFTPMENTRRHLILLEGIMEITHPGRYTKCLYPYTGDSFLGHWGTESKGRCRDFNLLCRNGWDGAIRHIILPGNSAKEAFHGGIVGYYPLDAELLVKHGDLQIAVKPGELLWAIPETKSEEYLIETKSQPTNCIVVSAWGPLKPKKS